MDPWFCGGKISSFRDVKEVSDRAVITACQIASAQEIIWIFFSFQRVLRNKSPHLSLICLGRVPLGGGSAWTERVLPEDYRMRGGEMRVYACVCVEVCTSECDGLGGVVAVMGLQAILSKTLQLSPRLYSAEQLCSFSSLFIIFSVFTCLCLISLKKKNKKKKHHNVKRVTSYAKNYYFFS